MNVLSKENELSEAILQPLKELSSIKMPPSCETYTIFRKISYEKKIYLAVLISAIGIVLWSCNKDEDPATSSNQINSQSSVLKISPKAAQSYRTLYEGFDPLHPTDVFCWGKNGNCLPDVVIIASRSELGNRVFMTDFILSNPEQIPATEKDKEDIINGLKSQSYSLSVRYQKSDDMYYIFINTNKGSEIVYVIPFLPSDRKIEELSYGN